jgi:FAD/FMN-containing dehydrogenase
VNVARGANAGDFGLSGLYSAVKGRVVLPGDEAFDQARRPWNLAIEQPVLAVVEAADAADVSAVIRYARSAGIQVATQPSGHGASGNTEGTILLRTGLLDDISVDVARRTAVIGAGVRSGQVQEAAAPNGLTGMPGSSPMVTVTGATLGGGLSWFARKYGWAADHVTAFEVVNAAGEQARVTASTDPDLFWALRGGGGDFAIVTAMELTLHAEPVLFGGRMVWPGKRSAEVLTAFGDVTADAPAELTVWAGLVQLPGSAPLVVVDATYLGQERHAREFMRGFDAIGDLISDNRGLVPMDRIGTITADPTDPGPGLSRAELVTGLDATTAEALLADPIDPLLGVQIRHLGGALSGACDSPHGPVSEQYLLYLLGLPFTPELAEAIHARQAEFAAVFEQAATGRKPFTFLAPSDRAAAAFGPDALARLRRIKRERDPLATIRSNYPVLD